jgi:hypothetical protein
MRGRGPILRLGGECGWCLSGRADQIRPSLCGCWRSWGESDVEFLLPHLGRCHLVALTGVKDLSDHANELFVGANWQPGSIPSSAIGRLFLPPFCWRLFTSQCSGRSRQVRISSSVRARQVSQGFINVLQEWSPMPLVGSSRLEFLLVHAIKLFVGATHPMKRPPTIARA